MLTMQGLGCEDGGGAGSSTGQGHCWKICEPEGKRLKDWTTLDDMRRKQVSTMSPDFGVSANCVVPGTEWGCRAWHPGAWATGATSGHDQGGLASGGGSIRVQCNC